jgi:hypothetical protein
MRNTISKTTAALAATGAALALTLTLGARDATAQQPTPTPLPPLHALVYEIPDTTHNLPDFSRLRPVGAFDTPTLDVSPRDYTAGFPGVPDRLEWFAILYEGGFNVARTDRYTFRLNCDDGARVLVDGALVVDDDGIHPPTSKSGTILLEPGFHTLEVQYFQGPKYLLALQLFVARQGEAERLWTTSL